MLATSFPALVALSLSLGALTLPGALALTIPRDHGILIPRQTNGTAGIADGSLCSFGFECASNFCRGTPGTCVDPASIVGQVAEGGECFDNASCETPGSVSFLPEQV